MTTTSKRAELLDLLLRKKGLQTAAVTTIARRAGAGPFPLSSAQERLWFLNQMDTQSAAYNISGTFQIDGELDITIFKQSISQIVTRHEVLRCSFTAVEGEPLQSVRPHSDLVIPVIDLSSLPKHEADLEVRRISATEANRPFDLSDSLLLRVTIMRLAGQGYIAIFAIHHIASDGWSIDIFMRELAMLYEAGCSEKKCLLPDLPFQYMDFAAWQKDRLKQECFGEQLAYWMQKLAGAPQGLNLPFDRPRPPLPSPKGAKQSFQFSSAVTDGLKEMSRQQGATLFMTLLSLFYALLYSYTREEDICIGTPATNRDKPGADLLIGLFVNTLVLRVKLSASSTMQELVALVRETSLEGVANQDIPFEMLVKTLEHERDLSRNPLFQVWFVLHSSPTSGYRLPGLTMRLLDTADKSVRHDLRLAFEDEGRILKGAFEYRSDLFDPATIELMIQNLLHITSRVLVSPQTTMSDFAEMIERANNSYKAAKNRQFKDASLQSLKSIRRKSLTARH